MSIGDKAPEDFKIALKNKWSGAPAAMDYYSWTKGSSHPVFGDWMPKGNKKKVDACQQPQVKEGIWSFQSMSQLTEAAKKKRKKHM
jgi:hypothetical protein